MYKFALALLLGLLACTGEEVKKVFQIASEAQSYVDRFFEEAENQGVILLKENLIVEFDENLIEGRCGECQKDAAGSRKVLIKPNSACWKLEPEQNKEALVFHELGHCLLGRKHKDELFPSGAPVSLMISALDGPYQPCEYVIDETKVEECNRTSRRGYYVEELFDPDIEWIPSWAN
ncbi:hypothetical protein LAG90_09455 [Marinilongibacter aquaticus]|uniref:hypothetical protein n=1 Tax=Marinilongibacter aquaticus TaxID=2975157 RepID=UPI0021BDD5DC|nr:hypothetical protein [Marinilongibacter aquaticus]UBM60859.1 hypothetical protein LAG90_09455 [Marinilongibacter aquaticus]